MSRRGAHYLVTGGTGFIGRFLLPHLLDRGATVHVLVRPGSLAKLEQLRERLGADASQLVALPGDIGAPRLGLSRATLARLKGCIDHVVHLAAIYDLEADAQSQIAANVGGTRHALECAKALGARCFHHVSSIAAAGLYDGTFTEEMLGEATGLEHPYYRTKHDAEALVRAERGIRWRIYRPGIVVGDSAGGEIDKIDGPYYFFPAIRRISRAVPGWLRALALRGGTLNIVPVDHVAAAMDHLMHLRGGDRRTFFITDPEGITVGELLRVLFRVAHGPRVEVLGEGRLRDLLEQIPLERLAGSAGVRQALAPLLARAGIPAEALRFIGYPTRFEARRTQALLARAGIVCPPFESYAPVLWRYWEQRFAAQPRSRAAASRPPSKRLRAAVGGRLVVITGASSGIGRELALQLGRAGARLVLVARHADALAEVESAIRAAGGEAFSHACDIADLADCDRLVARVLKAHGPVDVLVNNAGRSIRRSVRHSVDRFHDFERTMQLNYFGALRLILGFLPAMLERRGGHIINVSSIGVLASPPRFSAYVASKAALDAFSACAAAECSDRDVRFTTVNMPLVRTPMIAPTRLYDALPALRPADAAALIANAIVERPQRVATSLGVMGAIARSALPGMSEFVLNQAYRLFPDSAAARGEASDEGEGSGIEIARRLFSQVFSGVHW